MAACSLSEVREMNPGEEMDSGIESGECASVANGKHQKKEATTNYPETDDTFKKPALFAVPSLTTRRGAAAPSKHAQEKEHLKTEADTTNDEASGSVNEHPTPEVDKEEDNHSDTVKISPPVKPKKEAKPRVLPVNGPPAGKFKPHPPLPYTEPPWGGVAPDISYALEILKNGAILDTVPLTERSYIVVGRLPVCDIYLEHCSISRYHAIIQYRSLSGEEGSTGEGRGFYIYDLGSTHGTVVNKNKIPPKTYIRLRVGHVLKFGGSTRLFILQGPDFDEEEESDFTVTELKERSRKQREDLERRMMGEGSDDEEKQEENEEEGKSDKSHEKMSKEDSGCSWGMAEEAMPEEDENEENPFATEFHEDQEAAYLKDPKKALQGFYDREGEELEFEYEDKNHGTWLCRIKLPVDDALGKQLVAEVTHTGKKKEAAIQCCLEACRILEARGVLRQEAVSRKRKKKNWEDEDYYDSDDDTFLDRTGVVEKKRQERMKKAGKIQERPDTYDSLVAKLARVEKDLAETQKKLNDGGRDSSGSSAEDPLDAFMSAVRSEAAVDAVERRRLHVHTADLRKEAQRLRALVELTRPAQMPSLQSRSESGTSDPQKPKKTLPLFGAMKGGSKFKLKTGTIGKLPPKRPNLPAELFSMKELPPDGEGDEEDEEEEEEEDDQTPTKHNIKEGAIVDSNVKPQHSTQSVTQESPPAGHAQCHEPKDQNNKLAEDEDSAEGLKQSPHKNPRKALAPATSSPDPKADKAEPAAKPSPKKSGKKKASRPAVPLSTQYPEDDPDYCVWMPPSGQSGDGRTHLNEKYGY